MNGRKAIAGVFVLLLSTVAQGQTNKPVSVSEILTLLRAGVRPQAVVQLLDRRADPVVVTEGDLTEARAAGANAKLMERLTARLETFRRLEALARAFEVHEEPESRLQFFVPKRPRPWDVQVTRRGSMVSVSMRPEARTRQGWFEQPRILVWLVPNTHFPAAAGDEVAERLGSVVRKRLGIAGFRPGVANYGLTDVAGAVGKEVTMSLKAPKTGFEGRLTMRSRILADGTVIMGVLAASPASFAEQLPRFDQIVESLEFRR